MLYSSVVTDPILSESVTAVGARGGWKAGLAVYEYISDNCEVVYVARGMLEGNGYLPEIRRNTLP